MKLRVKPMRFRIGGMVRTDYIVERLCWYGWDFLYHRRIIGFQKREDANEYVRLYRSLKRPGGGRNLSADIAQDHAPSLARTKSDF